LFVLFDGVVVVAAVAGAFNTGSNSPHHYTTTPSLANTFMLIFFKNRIQLEWNTILWSPRCETLQTVVISQNERGKDEVRLKTNAFATTTTTAFSF